MSSVFMLRYNLALSRRCYECRSRGELGSCKDPFKFNSSDVDNEPGLSTVSCPSGWCGKVIEGGGAYAVDGKFTCSSVKHSLLLLSKCIIWTIYMRECYLILDYDQAIQRMCVNRGPDDNQDRCTITAYNYKKVYMCLCQGDLCNSAPSTRAIWWWPFEMGKERNFLQHLLLLTIMLSYTILVIPLCNIFAQIHFS